MHQLVAYTNKKEKILFMYKEFHIQIVVRLASKMASQPIFDQ